MPKALKFSDLYLRVLSALVILCVVVLCIYLGNIFYVLLLLFLTAVIFFEANVTGNWLWLESSENHPILDELVDLLSSKLEQ